MRILGLPDTYCDITGAFRVGDIRYACANITAAQELLGWNPEAQIEEGLALLAKWARLEYESK